MKPVMRDEVRKEALVRAMIASEFMWQMRVGLNHVHGARSDRRINRRAETSDMLGRFSTPEGKVNFEVSGMDCDGVQYVGSHCSCEATREAYYAMMDEQLEWADGPMYFNPITQEQSDKMQYSSRDLGMEAFENGHSHCLHV